MKIIGLWGGVLLRHVMCFLHQEGAYILDATTAIFPTPFDQSVFEYGLMALTLLLPLSLAPKKATRSQVAIKIHVAENFL